jgi:asparagine synthase (glutamine-hydrolysing)
MCGISGLLTDRLAPDAAARVIQGMNDAQRHRGPDGHAVWNDAFAYLGHRRLAIIDLTASGTQPMTNEDETIVLVCNGEIYNFRELRDRLRANGHRFKSNTDIEVIIHQYEEDGDDCANALVGMFAFAIWDIRRRHLLLVRDRVGEKPLYYAQTNTAFAFASEIAPLLGVPGVDTTLDQEALTTSLIYPSLPAPLTMFSGIRAVAPASKLTFDGGRLTERRYWRIQCSENTLGIPERQAVEELDSLLGRAVRGSLIADVPVGLMLSGGVDSSAIAAHASRAGAEIRAFSISYDSPERPDPDLLRAREVAAQFGLPLQEIPFAPVDLGKLPAIVARYGQPFNVFPMLYADQLAQGVRQHVTVALGGNGADEIFGGYRGYNRHLGLSAAASLIRHIPKGLAGALPFGADRLARLQAAVSGPIEERRGRALNQLATQLGSALFTPEFAVRARSFHPGDVVTAYARECAPRDYLDTVQYSDLMAYHQHGTTVITDVSGMSHSLEIRAPFLDHRLVEFAFSLPRRMRVPSIFRPNRNKYLLKRTLERTLPHGVLYGRKYGFGYNISVKDLLAGPWRAAVQRFVGHGRYLDLGIYSSRGANWAIGHAPSEVWRLLVFSIWAEIYVFGESVGDLAARLSEALDAGHKRDVA